MSKTAAAYDILEDYGKSLTIKEIISIALERGLIETHGLTPDATLNADIINENKRKIRMGRPTRFVRVGPQKWGLVEWFDKHKH